MIDIDRYKKYLDERQEKLNELMNEYKHSLYLLYQADMLITSYYKDNMATLNSTFAEILEIKSEIDTLMYMIRALDSNDEDFGDVLPF